MYAGDTFDTVAEVLSRDQEKKTSLFAQGW